MVYLKRKEKVEVKRVPLTLRVDPAIRQFCVNQSNASRLIEELIRKSAEYREWVERNGGGE